MEFKDRIKSLRRVPASSLRPSPRNWRTHPKEQRDALRGVLADVGLADACLVRELDDGSLELIDGHLRAEELGDAKVPVLVLDVTEAEAHKILLTLDPLSALADADVDRLRSLLDEVETDNAAVNDLLAGLAEEHGLEDIAAEEEEPADETAELREQFQVLVICKNEKQQAKLLTDLAEQGYECRSLIS